MFINKKGKRVASLFAREGGDYLKGNSCGLVLQKRSHWACVFSRSAISSLIVLSESVAVNEYSLPVFESIIIPDISPLVYFYNERFFTLIPQKLNICIKPIQYFFEIIIIFCHIFCTDSRHTYSVSESTIAVIIDRNINWL